MGRGIQYPVLSYINNISDCAGIEEKGKKDEEQELDISNIKQNILWMEIH